MSLDPAPAQPQQGGGGGRRGGRLKEKVVENKKDEMKEYMEQAAALVHSYVPPDPAKIQAAKDAGRITTNPQAAGKVRLVISRYLKPGDSLTLDLDAAASRLTGLGVNAYLDKPDEPVDAGGADERPGRRRDLCRPDDAGGQGEEHHGGDPELGAPAGRR